MKVSANKQSGKEDCKKVHENELEIHERKNVLKDRQRFEYLVDILQRDKRQTNIVEIKQYTERNRTEHTEQQCCAGGSQVLYRANKEQ